ncbi:ABC transporter ATP-binding protein/permease [Secundilactobacillus paracollinoides]|uniref:ABC transporter ATP-binding protein n=1 Tax=Secundilactobacillus paracollinoides TaxID=240427 RepID=A0A1B2IXN9_9LACO|nr:ABC transporter ATP-binding protein/permease [Secundilactobacillus paracollinoides]ANZ60944.1 ABC transporter ATP-binding protein [Secundilactobacillus paracollinoides]ANZ66803.1 ABC transporter ATP-binding protein [Secundilactobacillus paracollinoides]
MSYLELRDIHKSYYLGKEEFPVLKGIDLNFDLGEFVSILGESGGGKSTLMNIIGGLDRQFQGSVTVDGTRLNHSDEKALDHYRRDTIGYIYQAYNLIGHLTVMDNVLIPLDMTTLSKADQKKRAAELLDRVGLKDQAHKYPNQLSGGQKQRVAIARALASDPKVIIADEPTGALDSENTKEVLEILDGIAQEGRLVITVTHSQSVADAGTRIVHLADGKIDKDTKLRDAYPVTDTPRLKSRLLPAAVSYTTAYKHFNFNFWRNSLIVLGTAVGLFAVMLFSGLGNGISGYINKQVNDLVNPTAVSISRYQKSATASTSGSGGSSKQAQAQQQQAMQQSASSMTGASTASSSTPTFSATQLKQLGNIKHVTGVSKVYTASSVTTSYNDKKATISSLQNWNASATSNTIKYGHKPKAGEIVIDKDSVAKSLSKNHWKDLIGKTITLSYKTTNKNGKPVTVKFKAKIAGITSKSAAASMASDNFVSTKTLTAAMNKANVSDKATSTVVKVDKIGNVNGVTKKINQLKTNDKRLYSATSVNSIISKIQTYVKLATNILSAIAAISLVVSALMIIVTMYMSVSARTKEIGILRALGESKRDIRRLFISESLIIGVLSAAFATVIALIGEVTVNHMLASIANYAFVQITVGNVVTVFVIGVVISLVTAFLPARRAAKLNPIDALAAD